MRKNGQLAEVKERLKKLEEKQGNTNEPGFCFCKGLYFFYRKNPQEALINFQRARRSKTYSDYAIIHMIDIYLNPDQDVFFSHLPELNKLKLFEDSNLDSLEKLLNILPCTLFPFNNSLSKGLVRRKRHPYNLHNHVKGTQVPRRRKSLGRHRRRKPQIRPRSKRPLSSKNAQKRSRRKVGQRHTENYKQVLL